MKQLGESGKLKQALSFLSHTFAVSPIYHNYLAFNSTLNFRSLVRFGCLLYSLKNHFSIDFTLISFRHCSLGVCICFSFLFPFQIHESGKVESSFPLTRYFLGAQKNTTDGILLIASRNNSMLLSSHTTTTKP